jgi:hypothetical protein
VELVQPHAGRDDQLLFDRTSNGPAWTPHHSPFFPQAVDISRYRRVLIVCPQFPPVNAADCQRVRMSLPHFREFGWEAHVLAVEPGEVEGFHDPDLQRTLPEDVPVTRVRGIPVRITRKFGFGGLWLRTGLALRRAGSELLNGKTFDVVYFSTTIFAAMTLGPRWRRKFGIPFVIDLQDPWVNDYYSRTGVRPPGGRVRYALAQWSAKRSEPYVVREAAHIITVSPAYSDTLRGRYPEIPTDRFTVLPFAASEADFALVTKEKIGHGIFDPADGLRHWVYLGRGGRDMAVALRGLFAALSELRSTNPAVNELRLHFVGTSYAAKGRAQQTIHPIAVEMGVGDLVSEQTDRLGFLSGLALLRSADAILIVGSDDPGYSASKVYPCVMAKRPLLAVLHADSPAAAIISKVKAGEVVGFASGEGVGPLAARLKPYIAKYLAANRDTEPETDWAAFAPYTAREMTRTQCAVFDSIVRSSS